MAELDEMDRTLLSFAAAQDLMLSSQLRQVGGEEVSVSLARAQRLCDEGLLRRGPRFRYQRGALAVTRLGLERVGSDLPVPAGVDVRGYWQAIGLGWLWVHAQLGNFGQVDAIFSRRAMRAADAAAGGLTRGDLLSESLAVKVADTRFALVMPDGRERYPGLVLVVPGGRIALELVFSDVCEAWVDDLIDAYGAREQVRTAVLIASSAERVERLRAQILRRGVGDRVQAQPGRMTYGSW